MPVTGVRGRQILDGDVTRNDLNVDTAGQAVIRRIIAGNGISISSTGADSGTGDVTIALSTVFNGTGFVRMSGTTPSYVTGTSSQFVKADGSLDSNVYVTNNLYIGDGTLSGNRTVTMNGNILNFTGGNVGILQSSPVARFEVGGHNANNTSATINVMEYSALGNTTITGYGAVGSNYWMDAGTLKRRKADVVSAIHFLNGGFEFLTASSGTVNSAITFSSLGRIFSNGNFVWGSTTDTGYKFDITGNFEVVHNNTFLQFYDNSNTPTLSIGRSSSSGWTELLFQGQEQKIRSNSSGEFQFFGAGGGWGLYTWVNNGTEKMRLTTSGNLLIGTTTMSSVYTTAELVLNDSSGYTYQEIRGTNQSTLVLTTGTSVGATPAVEIYNSYNFGIKFIQTGESTFLMFYHGTNKYLTIDTNSTERMRITSDGNVGINTTNPSTRLDVVGRFRYSYSDNASTDGQFGSSQSSTYTTPSNTSNRNLYNNNSTLVLNFTNGALLGAQSYNVAADFSQVWIYGNNGTTSTQPIRAYLVGLVGGIGQPAMNISDFRYFDVKSPDAGSISGHQIGTIYGIRIGQMRGVNNFTITTSYGIFQEGANDVNYFAGDTIFNRLAGTGTRMVVVDANGQLSTQAIPSGGGGGITTLNTLTAATQTFSVGTSGNDFNISSSTSTHTFNIPDASLTARGLITTGAQTISGNKIIRGTSTLNTEFALIVQNSAGTMLFQVRNDGGNVTVPSELRATGGISTNQITTFSTGNVNFPAQINTVNISIANNSNIILGTTNGSKIGTATNQRLGFWNATPIVQPTTAIAAAAFVANTGTAVNDASTFDGYTMRQVVKALRDMGLLA